MKRDILNYLGQKIGEMELPDSTTEQEWSAKLAPYAVAPVSAEEQAQLYIKKSIKQRKEYAEDLIERFKALNLNANINALQALWLQHRMRKLDITVGGVPFSIDILNLCISGDVEVACIALQYATPDDMSLPYHWFSEEKRQWLIADMKQFLGWS